MGSHQHTCHLAKYAARASSAKGCIVVNVIFVFPVNDEAGLLGR